MKLIFSVILLNPVYSKIISVAFLLLFLSKCRKKHQKQELLFLYFQVIQGGTCAIDKETGVAISYPIEFASFVGYLSAVPISVGPTVLDIIPTLNVYNSGNRENFGVWVRQNGVHITISIKWLAVGY